MYSTWVDNDHNNTDAFRRIDSASKRAPVNRIQVVSKINQIPDRIPIPQPFSLPNNMEQMNQTCVDKGNKIPFRRANTVEGNTQKDQRDRNVLKLMQEQLQLAKKSYEEKIKEQLKESSIQLSKLKIKIQNNSQLIASKDQLIEQLRSQLRQGSPAKQQSPRKQVLPGHVLQKITDMQTKFNLLVDSQNKLGYRMNELSGKVERVQKGLLSLLACKLSKIQSKFNELGDICTHRLTNLEMVLQAKVKKQEPNINVKGIFPSTFLQPGSENLLLQKLEMLKQQVHMFKSKQFRYENTNIGILRNQFNSLQNIVTNLQRKFLLTQSRLRNSRSSRKNYQINGKQNSNNSCFFEDYQEVYEDVDSFGQDQFFHPLQQSTRKFTSKQFLPSHDPPTYPHHPSHPSHPYSSHSKPSKPTHNDSFEKFTSDEEQEEGQNEKRLIGTLIQNGYKLPLPIQIDLTGYLRKKSDQNYLLDAKNKKFMFTTQQLMGCRNRGWIVW